MVLKKYSPAFYMRQRIIGRGVIIHQPIVALIPAWEFLCQISDGIKHSIARDAITKQNPHVGQTKRKELEFHLVLLVFYVDWLYKKD